MKVGSFTQHKKMLRFSLQLKNIKRMHVYTREIKKEPLKNIIELLL